MRFAFVIGSLELGGAQRVMAAIAGDLAAAGDAVTVITISGTETDAVELPEGVDRVALGLAYVTPSFVGALRRTVREVRELRRSIRRIRPDAALSFLDHTNVLTLLACARSRVPVVVSERADPRHHPLGVYWDRLRRITYRWAANLVVQSDELRAWAGSLVDAESVRVIPNFPLVEPRVPCAERQPVVAGAGRLTDQKGFDLLIEAFGKLAATHPEWRLRIHGDGPRRAKLEAQVERLGLADRIELPGPTPDLAAEFAHVGLFVLPSRYEGFPNVLLEAMACGAPVVAFNCPSGPADIVRDGVDGLLAPAGDVGALTKAMDSLMRDGERRSVLGERAREVRDRFARGTIVGGWREMLAQAAAGAEER